MAIVVILLVLVFSTTLCFLEIPKMLNNAQYKELWTFSILLGLGNVLTIFKSLNVYIPNPLDFIAWVYSPFANIMKGILM